MPAHPGLTTSQAEKLLAQHGPNHIPETPPPPPLVIFASQIKNPLIYVLIAAAVITFFLGDFADFTVISLAIVLNTIIGFFQEQKAIRTLTSLKSLLSPQAQVIRDGKPQSLAARLLVPGDLVILNQGDKVPADGTLFEAEDLFLNEAILTGESQPRQKHASRKIAAKSHVYHVWMGTLVVAGSGKFLVTATGKHTQLGQIAHQVQQIEETTALKRHIQRLARTLTLLILALATLIFISGVALGDPLEEIFPTTVALAVSAIPEGLPVSLTVVLAIAMGRIAAKKGLVKRLLSAETLGSVTVICADKTGTLTEGHMRVVTARFTDDKLGALSALLVNNFHNPLEIAMARWSLKQIKTQAKSWKLPPLNHFKNKTIHPSTQESILAAFPRLDIIPFSSKTKFIATLNQVQHRQLALVSGAPELILSWTKPSQLQKQRWQDRFNTWAGEGRRLVGFAYRPAKKGETRLVASTLKHHLTWLGVILFEDPPRKGVARAIKKTLRAGIKIKVITGDYPQTAASILSQLNFPVTSDQILTGDELAHLPEDELKNRLADTVLFARTTPEQKLTIVKALKDKGEIVAMTGDGVNDAPALAAADIGLVVAEASDVAKETADMVLLDSNFATITHAIEEGRNAFANLRKIILYLLSDAFAEIILIIGSMLARLPLPLTAVQILWINLISDGLPDIALTFDPKDADIMRHPPRHPRQPVINSEMGLIIALVSAIAGLSALIVFSWFYTDSGSLALARSLAFVFLGINSLFYVFSCRSLTRPVWKTRPFSNRFLIAAVGTGFILQSLPFYLPPLSSFFKVVPLHPLHLLVAVLGSLLLVILIEIIKWAFVKIDLFNHRPGQTGS